MEPLSKCSITVGVWVRDEKHFYSEKAEYDIGVPDTVERIFKHANDFQCSKES